MNFFLVLNQGGKRVIKWPRVVLWAGLVMTASVLLCVPVIAAMSELITGLGLLAFLALIQVLLVVIPLWRRLRLPVEKLPSLDAPPRLVALLEHSIFNWRTLRFCCFVVASLMTLIAAFYNEEKWRGKHAWRAYVRVQEAKGGRLDVAAFVPPLVPDDQNFAMCPLLRAVLDYEFGSNVTSQPVSGPQQTRVWRDTNGLHRLEMMHPTWSVQAYQRERAKDPHLKKQAQEALSMDPLMYPDKGWINLPVWQAYFRTGTNLAGMGLSNSPARDVLLALRYCDRDVLELEEAAARRPLARWPVHYDDLTEPWGILLPHLSQAIQLTLLLEVRASAHLAAEEPESGMADVHLGIRIADSFREEPFLISQLVRDKCLGIMLHPVAEGLARHQFTETQLAGIQAALSPIDLLAAYQRALLTERAMIGQVGRFAERHGDWPELLNGVFPLLVEIKPEFLLHLVPTGWIYQGQLDCCRLLDRLVLPAVDPAQRRVFPQKAADFLQAAKQLSGASGLIPNMLLRSYERFDDEIPALRFALRQTDLDETVLACALERYRLAHGEFPDILAALTPQFIAKLPHDLITGEPLHYQRKPDGRYLLYSVGWNGKDDGGQTVLAAKSNRPDPRLGDWVWRWPGE